MLNFTLIVESNLQAEVVMIDSDLDLDLELEDRIEEHVRCLFQRVVEKERT